jgi:plastocyanin
MHKLLLMLISLGALALTGAGSAATVTVTVTKSGYVPKAVTIAPGDSVQFTNSDTVPHQIVFKSTSGITCVPNPLVLQATQTGTCTFQSAGSSMYSDPNTKGNTFRGTVTVTGPQQTIALSAAPQLIAYGANVALSGILSSHAAGENVDVLAQACGASAAAKVATVQTTSNGAFSASVSPLMNTTYTVKVRNTTSNAATLSVRPKLRLGKVGPHRYSLRVNAAQSLAGKYANFQRYNGTRWVAVKTVLLRAGSTGIAPTVISAATFRSGIKGRLRVRAVLGQAQAGTCYLPGTSNTILS